MNDKIQSGIKTLIFSIFSIIIGLIVIRLFLKLVGANPYNDFAKFWYSFTDTFVYPFNKIYPSITIGRMIIETYSIVAVLFYILIALISSKSATSPFEDTRKQAIIEIVDSLFKITEFLLITRFIFKITGASISAPFVDLIYKASWIVYEPFATLLPAIKIDFAIFELSTLIATVVIIILDIVTEQFLYSLLSFLPDKPKVKKFRQKKVVRKKIHQPNNPLPQAQNITINIPQPANTQPPTYIDQRSINVHSKQPKVRKSQQKGFLQYPKPRSPRQGGPGA